MQNHSVAWARDSFRINDALLEKLFELSFSNSSTRRLNMHESLESTIQAMLVESEANSREYIHCHQDSDEIIFPINGSFEICFYKVDGSIQDKIHCNPTKDNTLANRMPIKIPQDSWHSINPISERSMHFEVKLGPYDSEKLKVFNGHQR